jgi:hypothetical protein
LESRVEDRQLELVVDALCAVETGRPPFPELPQATACWFLERAEHFSAVAFSALRLIERLARRGNDAIKARAALALGSYVTLYPTKVEQLLVSLAASQSRDVREGIIETLVRLLQESDDRGRVIERWWEHSDDTRELLHIASKLFALRSPDREAHA